MKRTILSLVGLAVALIVGQAASPLIGPESSFTQGLKTNVNAADWRTALQISNAPFPHGIVGYWPLNEPTNSLRYSIAEPSAMTAANCYGTNKISSTNGIIDGATVFTGDQYLYQVDWASSGRFSPQGNPFTVNTWVWLDDTSTNAMIVGKFDSYGLEYSEWGLFLDATNTFRFSMTDGASRYDATNSCAATGQWFMVTGKYDAGTLKLFVNGAEVASTTQTVAPPLTTTTVIIGGDWECDPPLFVNGRICDVSYFSRGLDAAEIGSLYNSGSGLRIPTPRLRFAGPPEYNVVELGTPYEGNADTFMRSDAGLVLSQSITPTWTGKHTFLTYGINNPLEFKNGLAPTTNWGVYDIAIPFMFKNSPYVSDLTAAVLSASVAWQSGTPYGQMTMSVGQNSSIWLYAHPAAYNYLRAPRGWDITKYAFATSTNTVIESPEVLLSGTAWNSSDSRAEYASVKMRMVPSTAVSGPPTSLELILGANVQHGFAGDSFSLVFATNNSHIGFKGGPRWHSGSGSPEGVITAPIGSFYSRTDGGSGTSFYVKESGTGNTGWTAK